MTKTDTMEITERYSKYRTSRLDYATVKDYCDSVDYLYEIASINNDLKDVQRSWIIKAIIANVPKGGSLLEIGAGHPWVADYLVRCGYAVHIVDPYDGRDRGPSEFDEFVRKYPNIRFHNGLFPEVMPESTRGTFDCVYSISVLEHIDFRDIDRVGRSMKAFTRDKASRIIHAIDFIQQGPGAEQAYADMRQWLLAFGFDAGDLDVLALRMQNDPETYLLSAASHNMWRGHLPYEQYPMRRISSAHVCVTASQLVG